MPRIIDDRTSVDTTVKIFDSFYQTKLRVDGAKFDIVRGFFVETSGSANIADNFTTVLFRISTQTGVDVLDLLDELKGKRSISKLKMNEQICYWLNGLKSKTSLYGISLVPHPNISVSRNVVS